MRSWEQGLKAILLALTALGCLSAASEPPKPRFKRAPWIERPWELRYFIAVYSEREDQVNARFALREQARHKLEPENTLEWRAVFDPPAHRLVFDPPASHDSDQALVIRVIEFDRDGTVLTPHSHGSPLRGRFWSRDMKLVLSTGDGVYDPVYPLGIWFQGFPGSEEWAPTLCIPEDEVNLSPFRIHRTYLYGKEYEHDRWSRSAGCREWGYQMYDSARPYIDVTSYRAGAKPKDLYIRNFIGWGRFEDRKPVIGMNEGHWYCLHDCPKGEAPGRIQNIRLWAARNGWAAPTPPKGLPRFKDSTRERDFEEGE